MSSEPDAANMILHRNAFGRQNRNLSVFLVLRGTFGEGDDKMKQNTKFLWIYISILFSFALILIIFAGLSRNSDIEQKEGLQGHVAQLSEEKLDLTNQVNSHLATIESLNQQINILTTENNNLKAADNLTKANENTLLQAKEAADKGDWKSCSAILDTINKDTLTQTQLAFYENLR